MRQRGFTLVELLIVLAVIGILASIGIPAMLDAIERSRQKRSMSDIRTVAGSVQVFNRDYGGYPSSAHNGQPNNTFGGVSGMGWQDLQGSPVYIPDYIQAIPPMDGWSWPLFYIGGPDSLTLEPRLNEAVAGHFCLYSTGLDVAEGGPVETDPLSGDTSDSGINIATAYCAAPPVITGIPGFHCYQTDIVFGDSGFLQRPDGRQRKC